MRRGTKPALLSEKIAKGVMPCRREKYELIDAPKGEVLPPDGLRLEAAIIWDEYAPMALAMGTLKPADALAFGQWCSVAAQIQACWATGDAAPANQVKEWRMLGELFGLAGEKSRIALKVMDAKPSTNPFRRNSHCVDS